MAVASDENAAFTQAGFGPRFSAFMIDGLLLFGAQWLAVIVLSRQLQAFGLRSQEPCSFDATLQCDGPNLLVSILLTILVFGTTLGYHAFFEGRYGATPGKRWMGIHVARFDGSTPIGIGVGLVRSVVRQAPWIALFLIADASPIALPVNWPVLFWLVPFVALVPIVWAAVAVDGRGIHDVLAETIVLRSLPDEKSLVSAHSSSKAAPAPTGGPPPPPPGAVPASPPGAGRSARGQRAKKVPPPTEDPQGDVAVDLDSELD